MSVTRTTIVVLTVWAAVILAGSMTGFAADEAKTTNTAAKVKAAAGRQPKPTTRPAKTPEPTAADAAKVKPGGGPGIRLWDTGRTVTKKHYGMARQWAYRNEWKLVPYGKTDYKFKGDAMLEGESFFLSFHSTMRDAVMLCAKIPPNNLVKNHRAKTVWPGRHNEFYRAYKSKGGGNVYGEGNDMTKFRIKKYDKNEIIVQASSNLTRGVVVTTVYRTLAGRHWLEITPVRATSQGMHGETRIVVGPEGQADGGDYVADTLKMPRNKTSYLSPKAKMMLNLQIRLYGGVPSTGHYVWVMTWPDTKQAKPYFYNHVGGDPAGWNHIGEGYPPIWTAPFAHYGKGKNAKIVVGCLNNLENWNYERVNKQIAAGDDYTSSRKAPYPGKWRLTGCVDGKYYTQTIVQTGTDGKFTFRSPVSGTLEYLLMYLYDRTDKTPGNISTPMDIYRQGILPKPSKKSK